MCGSFSKEDFTGDNKLKKRKAAIDLDDTSWQFMASMCAYHNREYGTNHELHHFTTFDLHVTWQCTKEEAKHRIARFCHSEHHIQIDAVPGAVESLCKLAQKYELPAVTAREPESAPRTLPLVERLFGNRFSEVHLIGHNKSKGEFCLELGDVAFVVDDGLHNAVSVGEKGILVYLMNRPWNQTEVLPPNTIRVPHWGAVLRHEGLE